MPGLNGPEVEVACLEGLSDVAKDGVVLDAAAQISFGGVRVLGSIKVCRLQKKKKQRYSQNQHMRKVIRVALH